MGVESESQRDRELRLDQVVASYLTELDSGVTPDRRGWLVRHPEFYDELSDFFADRDQVEQVALPLRQIAAGSEEALALEGLEPPAHPEHLGRLSGYEVTACLGRGGMGVVFKAFDETLNRFVAIKLMAPQWSADVVARRRFTREAQAAAAISHAHVVTIHAVGEWHGRSYLVMEYISGSSLDQRLSERGPLELNEILQIGSQVASGLAAAHAQGLIHRDVKPANIMLENGLPRVKLTDFGLARAVDDVRLTQHGFLAGTPQYMAPEQAQGERLDRRADLFSLGSVLYALCTGRPAFAGESTVEVIHRVCESTPPPIQELNPNIPDWLVEIVARLHAKDASDRFQNASEVAVLLERHLARLQDPTLPPVVHDWVTPRARPSLLLRPWSFVRRRWPVTLAIVLLGIIVTFEFMRFYGAPQGQEGRQAPVANQGDGEQNPETKSPASPPRAVGPPAPLPSSCMLLSTVDPSRLVESYDQSFLDKNYDFRWLRIDAPGGATSLVTPDPRGVRMKVPAEFANSLAIETKFGIHGDFDLSAAYEILSIQTPLTGFGVGPELLAKPPGDWDKTVSLSRFARPKDNVYSACSVRKIDGETKVVGRWPKTTAKSGTLRLVRTGATVHFLVAEGDSQEFREIYEEEFGTEDMQMARLAAITGGSSQAVDILWKNLTVRAEDLPGLPSSTPASANRNGIGLVLSGLVLLTLAGAIVWWRAATRGRTNKPVLKH
jgi:serine/threonine protein kinase